MSTSYMHPISGEPCSRQRVAQVRNSMNGVCLFHAKRSQFNGTQYCKECLDKTRAKSTQARPSRIEWSRVDWDLSNRQIASNLNVTPTAVSYHRRNRSLGTVFTYKASAPKATPRKYFEVSNEQRETARLNFRSAVLKGSIIPKPCAVCGDSKSEGHHFDYTRPLEVIWLCKTHHGLVHRGARQLIWNDSTEPPANHLPAA